MTAYDTTETRPGLTRRAALKAAAAAGATLAMPAIASAASDDTIRIGFISPVTGPLGLFGETDSYTLEKIRKHFANGLEIGGKTYQVKVFDRDAQSDPNKASELAGDLILNEKIHLMIPASTTDIINSAADQCELNGVPAISSGAPWQAVVMPRGGDKKPFEWTYHFFWGLEDVLATYVGLWQTIETNEGRDALPRNADGETWGNDSYGLAPAVRKAGFETVVPSMFQPRTNDFSAQIDEIQG